MGSGGYGAIGMLLWELGCRVGELRHCLSPSRHGLDGRFRSGALDPELPLAKGRNRHIAAVDGRMRTPTSLTAAALTIGHLAYGPRVALINGDSLGQHLFRSKGAENVQI